MQLARRPKQAPGSRRRAVAVACLGLVAVPSCSGGGCKRGTPYVPFLDDAAATPPAPLDPPTSDAAIDAGSLRAFAGVHAFNAPPGATSFAVDGLSIDAPPGQAIVTALAYDVDADGKRDVVAYVQPAGGGGGELRLYRGESATKVASASASAPLASSELGMPAPCAGKATLSLVGAHSVAIDVRPACGDATPTPRRYALVAFAPTPAVRWSARVGELPQGWTFAIEAESIDRDGDGIDDPTLTFALEGGGPPFEPGDRVAAKLKFIDRPAGLARDRIEPESSFQAIAQSALQKASKKATALGVAAQVTRLRILHAAVCAEGGWPLLDVGGDHGVACGPSRALEDATVAEVRAALALGDPIAAIAARGWLSIGALTHTKRSRDEVDRAINAALPTIWTTTHDVKAVPITAVPTTALPTTAARGVPTWGSLAFDKGGDLLVRTISGVARVDANSLDDDGANDVTSWPAEVIFPGKDVRLSGVADPCDGPSLGAKLSGHDVPTGSTTVLLPLLARLAVGRCSGGRGASASVVPIAWGSSGLLAAVDLEMIWIPGEATTASGGRATGTLPPPSAPIDGPYVSGSPRSPSGDMLVLPTRFGLVRRDETAETMTYALLRSRELEGLYATLRECTIANDGLHVACVREGKVILLDTNDAASAASASASAPLPPLPSPAPTPSTAPSP